MKKHQIRNSLLLLLTAVIWGVAFVAQSVGMDHVGPFTFNCVRSLIGSAALVPGIALLRRISPQKEALAQPRTKKNLIIGGICCGIALAVASSLQQIGIAHTTVGKAGFITAFYIVIVPVLGRFLGKKCGAAVWAGVLLALAGLYFLCINENMTIGRGDIFVFLSALCFSVHILLIDHFSPLADGVALSCVQFFVSGCVCAVPTLLFEHPQMGQILAAWMPILYAGVLSCGVGYTLQVVGQKDMDPTVASLILSLESVVSALAGMLILHQRLSGRELLGCCLMFAAVLLAEVRAPKIPAQFLPQFFQKKEWTLK